LRHQSWYFKSQAANIMRINYWQDFQTERFYHIYNRSVGKEKLFIHDGNCDDFLQKWDKYLKSYLDTYAYCLMGNHFHFVSHVKPLTEMVLKSIGSEHTRVGNRFLNNEIDYNTFLVDQFKRFFSAYALKFNKQHERHGSIYQERFKRVQIAEGISLLDKICYVHHNPIHHGYHGVYKDWRYSSYDTYLDDKVTSIEREKGLALFKNRERFMDYHQIYKENWKKWNSLDDDM
jgi:putative transposase